MGVEISIQELCLVIPLGSRLVDLLVETPGDWNEALRFIKFAADQQGIQFNENEIARQVRYRFRLDTHHPNFSSGTKVRGVGFYNR